MEHIAAIMMLVGCTQGNIECKELSAPAVGFETTEECQQLLKPSIAAVRGTYKVVYGKCAGVDPALYIEDATINWEITPTDELAVEIVFDDPSAPMMVAQKTGRTVSASN